MGDIAVYGGGWLIAAEDNIRFIERGIQAVIISVA